MTRWYLSPLPTPSCPSSLVEDSRCPLDGRHFTSHLNGNFIIEKKADSYMKKQEKRELELLGGEGCHRQHGVHSFAL